MAWYSAALNQHLAGGGDSTDFCATDPQNTIELTLGLGSSLLDSTTSGVSGIARWTLPTSGLLATSDIVITVVKAFQNVSPDGSVRENAGVVVEDVRIPLSEFAIVTNSCSSPSAITDCTADGQELLMHKCISLTDATKPMTSTVPGTTRTLVARGIRGMRVVKSGTDDPIESSDENTAEPVSDVMVKLDSETNCFPTVGFSNSCHLGQSEEAVTFAAPNVDSAAGQCSGGFSGTPCDKLYVEPGPARFRADLEVVQKYTLSADTWTAVPDEYRIYVGHIASSGSSLPNSSACFPYPHCPSNLTESIHRAMPAWALGTIIALAVLAVLSAIASIWVYRRRQHKEYLRQARIMSGAHHRSVASASVNGDGQHGVGWRYDAVPRVPAEYS
jgi:hypothetical protein